MCVKRHGSLPSPPNRLMSPYNPQLLSYSNILYICLQENLRKHVLSTSLHPGKTIYECDTCLKDDSQEPYRTNFAKELRAHLLEAHPQDFPRPSDASDHVARIFKTDQEPALTMPEQDPDEPTT